LVFANSANDIPESSALFIEKAGRVVLVSSLSGNPTKSTYLQLANIDNEGEKGPPGITLDPNFDQNGYFYLFYVNSQTNRAQVSRFTHQGDLASTLSETVVWEDHVTNIGQQEKYHWGGGLTFGPGGFLFLAIGDKYDQPSDAQSLIHSAGKILRLDVSTIDELGEWQRNGTNTHIIPTDNPFNDGPGGNLDEIWALGLRNPYKLYWDEPDALLYITDVGGNVQDGINASHEDIHIAKAGDGGANFGWPSCEGPSCSGSSPLNYSAPAFSIQHRDARAIIGGVVYRGQQFPIEYHGAFFFTDYTKGWLRYIFIDDTGRNAQSGTPKGGFKLASIGTLGKPIHLSEGLGGELFYLDIIGINATGGGKLGRVSIPNGNQPPQIDLADAFPTESNDIPMQVQFSSSATDNEGDAIQYVWSFGDGNSGYDPNPSHVYTTAGKYYAQLTVSDNSGTRSSEEIEITVGLPPVVSIDPDLAGATFRAAQQFVLRGSGSENGVALTQDSYEWTITFIHDDHEHPVFSDVAGYQCLPQGSTCVNFEIPSSGHDFSGFTAFEVTLKATDADGLFSTDTVWLFPEKVDLHFDSDQPVSINFLVNDVPLQVPFTLDSLIGFQHTVNTPESIDIGGTIFPFEGWNVGGFETTLFLTKPSSNANYTAMYGQGSLLGGTTLASNTFYFPRDDNRWKIFDLKTRKNVCRSWVDGLLCTVDAGNTH
jgi:glucose/arabinose dehydrogenase